MYAQSIYNATPSRHTIAAIAAIKYDRPDKGTPMGFYPQPRMNLMQDIKAVQRQILRRSGLR